MGQGILIHLFQVAMTMVQVNIISGLPHLCTQRLEIFHRFSFAFSALQSSELFAGCAQISEQRIWRIPGMSESSIHVVHAISGCLLDFLSPLVSTSRLFL